jgi:hypothetical protein
MDHIYIICPNENKVWFNYYTNMLETYKPSCPFSFIKSSENIFNKYINTFNHILTNSKQDNEYYVIIDAGVILTEDIWLTLNDLTNTLKTSSHSDLAHLSIEASFEHDSLCYSYPMQSMIIAQNALAKLYNYFNEVNCMSERFDIAWVNALNALNIRYTELGSFNVCKNTNLQFTENINLLRVYDFPQKIRLGEKADGGYVIGDLSGSYDCYISAGVGDNESFSEDFLSFHKVGSTNSFAFDGTISEFPTKYKCDIQFIRKNIGELNDELTTNLSEQIDKYNDIFLKMDIESGEYPWLMWILPAQLQKFKQIAIELHSITSDHEYNNSIKMTCLRKLCETHYLIHAHGNNGCNEFGGIPVVIELTFVRKTEFNSVPKWNTNPLPIPKLDYPNCDHNAEIMLNHFPFVQSKRESDN